MGFKKIDIVSDVTIKLTYPHLYKDEKGKPIEFAFTFHRQNQAEKDSEELQDKSLLDRFCDLLIAEPVGFDDFPNSKKPLRERAKEYFGSDDMGDFVKHSLERYWRVVLPEELFRGV